MQRVFLVIAALLVAVAVACVAVVAFGTVRMLLDMQDGETAMSQVIALRSWAYGFFGSAGAAMLILWFVREPRK